MKRSSCQIVLCFCFILCIIQDASLSAIGITTIEDATFDSGSGEILNSLERTTQQIQILGQYDNVKCYSQTEVDSYCLKYLEQNDSTEDDTGVYSDVDEALDLNVILGSWISITSLNGTELKSNAQMDWRVGPMETRNRHLLRTGLYSDSSFVVGEGNDIQLFHVHKLLLQRSSSVFETLYNITSNNKEQHFRISDVQPHAFKILLEYMYTGNLCLSNYEDACSLLHLAMRFQVSDITPHCRSYLWTNLYPNNVWRGYQCAEAVNDTEIMEAALLVTQRKTEDVLNDPQFTEIPHRTLITFLSQENMNIKSELQLFDSSIRWAKAETLRQKLPENSESYRNVLGDALNFIRFLTLTASEFANMQFNTQILTCNESLAITFNLISPGVKKLPENLSDNKNIRKINSNITYIKVIKTRPDLLCSSIKKEEFNKYQSYSLNTDSVFTYKQIAYSTTKRIYGIQIPTQIKLNSTIETYDEDLTVFILSYDNKIASFIHFKATVKYNTYVTIGFKEKVTVPACIRNIKTCALILIDFHTSGIYPSTYLPQSGTRLTNGPHRSYLNGIKPYTLTWFFDFTDFIYSMFTDYNSNL